MELGCHLQLGLPAALGALAVPLVIPPSSSLLMAEWLENGSHRSRLFHLRSPFTSSSSSAAFCPSPQPLSWFELCQIPPNIPSLCL